MNVAIRLDNVATSLDNVRFAYRRRTPPVLDGFNWSVQRSHTLLLGPNGAGKSTLLQLIAGIVTPQSGALSGHVGSQAGFMPQTVKAVGGLTVLDQVSYCGWLKGMSTKDARESGRSALEAVQLVAKQHERARALSGGQLRRLGLAQAMVGESKILLLDEPTAGLDPAQRDNFETVLSSLTVPVIVATHQIDDIQTSYQHVAVLLSGRLAFDGTVSEFLERDGNGHDDPLRAYRAVLAEHAGESGL